MLINHRFFIILTIVSFFPHINGMSTQFAYTQFAYVTAGILSAAATVPLGYEFYKDIKRKNCSSCKYQYEHSVYQKECESHERHHILATSVTLGLLTAAVIAYRRSPYSIINRAAAKIDYDNLLPTQVNKIISGDNLPGNKFDRLAQQYVQSQVPLAKASKHLDLRLNSLLNAQELLHDVQEKICTAEEIANAQEWLKKLDPELKQLMMFMSELKKTPEYYTAMKVQAKINSAKAARDNANANELNAFANIVNATRPRH